jgi:hypothetical protein
MFVRKSLLILIDCFKRLAEKDRKNKSEKNGITFLISSSEYETSPMVSFSQDRMCSFLAENTPSVFTFSQTLGSRLIFLAKAAVTVL